MSYLKKTSDEEVRKMSVLLCGRNKTWKTTLASQFPKPLIINTDPNIAALEDLNIPMFNIERMTEENKKDKDKLLSFKDVRKIIVNLRDKDGPFYDELKEEGYEPETIVLDSISSLSDLMESEIMVSPPITDKGVEGGQRNDALQLQDYNRVQRRLFGVLDLFRNLPYHKVATCWLDLSTDDRNRIVEQPAATGSKLGPKIPHFFNEIYLLTRDDKENFGDVTLSVVPTRTASFPGSLKKGLRKVKTIKNPTYEKIMEAYHE